MSISEAFAALQSSEKAPTRLPHKATIPNKASWIPVKGSVLRGVAGVDLYGVGEEQFDQLRVLQRHCHMQEGNPVLVLLVHRRA